MSSCVTPHLIIGDFAINESFEEMTATFYLLLFTVIFLIKKRVILDKEDNLLLVKNKFFFVKGDVFNIAQVEKIIFSNNKAKLISNNKTSNFIVRDKQNFIDQILSVNPNITIVK